MEYKLKGKKAVVDVSLLKDDLKITKSAAGLTLDFPDLRKGALEDRYDVSFGDDTLKITEKSADLNMSKIIGNSSGLVVLGIPDIETDITVSVKSGDVDCDTLKGSADLTCYSGDITIGGAMNGNIKIKTYSGDVSIQELNGSLYASVISGDLSVNSGNISALGCKTMSGDISISAAFSLAEDAKIKSVAGDVSVNILERTGDGIFHVKTVSGDTDLKGEKRDEDEIVSAGGAFTNGFDLSGLDGLFSFAKKWKKGAGVRVDVNKPTDSSAGRIIDMLDQGKITASQAEDLLRALKGE